MLLERSKCDDDICQSLKNYYDSREVKFENVLLLRDEVYGISKLSDIRIKFLDSIIAQTKSYFPNHELKLFKIFHPKEIPSEIADSLTYGVVEIHGTYKTSNSETFAFWSHFLNTPGIDWTEKTKKLIQSILVIPIGSAEAERGFSIFNHIKAERRATLTGRHVEDFIRVRMNGPDELEKFSASKYAKQFLSVGHLKTDNPRYRKKKAESLLNDEEKNKKYLPKLSFL